MSSGELTVVVTVPSIAERDEYIKRIYTNLTKEPNPQFTVQQDQTNRIRVFHNVSKEVRVLINTYVVVVIPVTIDLTPLDTFEGIVYYHLTETIEYLRTQISRLEAMQGQRTVKGTNNDNICRELTDSLSELFTYSQVF